MTSTARYAVSPWLVAFLCGGSLAAFAAAPLVDQPGRLLVLVLGAVAGAEGVRSALQRPVLRADDREVEVVTGLTRQRFPWERVTALGTLAPPASGGRLRRRANALEIDLGDELVVVPGYRLGAPVPEVVSALSMVRGNGGGC